MVSRVALGCMSLRPGTDDSISIIHRAMDAGINFFDTADLYNGGANEEMLGKALAHKRASVIIATKVGNQLNPDGKGWKWNPSRAYILSAVDESLRRLQTDYIDLYQLHGGTMDDPLDETISAFEQLVQEGKIRYYGLSSIRPNVISYWVEHAHPASVMMQYSLLDRRPEESCLTLLQQNQIGVLARGGLAQGLLAGKKPTAYLGYTAEQVSLLAKSLQQHAGGKQGGFEQMHRKNGFTGNG